jgi:hypothetical protein
MNNTCMVKECRWKHTHTTIEHICGICGDKGHGQLECGNNELIDELKKYYNDMIDEDERCNLYNCKLNQHHKTESHKCESCFTYGHSQYNCPNRIIYMNCPLCRKPNKIKTSQKKVIGIDIDCCICMDRKIEIFFKDCGHIPMCFQCFHQYN